MFKLRDAFITVGVLIVMVAVLASINPRVREHVGGVAGDGSAQHLGASGNSVLNGATEAAAATLAVVSTYADGNPFLFWFLVVAVLLFALMLRT